MPSSSFKRSAVMTIMKRIVVRHPKWRATRPTVAKKLGNDLIGSYLENTTLHGLRYVGQSEISLFERVFFAAAFVIVFLGSAYFIANIYARWTAVPLIITMDARSTSVTDIPFPAVTICNMNQARKSVAKSFVRDSNDELLLQSLCNSDGSGQPATGKTDPATVRGRANDTSWHSFRQLLLRVSQPCGSMLLTCQFGATKVRCMDVFRTVLTDEGLCCTFNAVDKQFLLQHTESESDRFDEDSTEVHTVATPYTPIAWTVEGGFPEHADRYTTYPRRAFGAGTHMGLTVLASVRANDYFCSSTNSAGFKVLLHPPTETPMISDYGFSVAPGHESFVVAQPVITSASPLLRSLARTSRKCVFASESRLVYYRTYSRRNCEMECAARLIVETCRCRLFYMPRVQAADAPPVNICNQMELECSRMVRLEIAMAVNATFRCDCLPGCFEINYGSRMTSVRLGSGFSVPHSGLNASSNKEFIERNYAMMHIFYEKKKYRGTSMEQFIGFTDFLSNIGGLLSLFMGFSFISAFELLYYVTLRPFFVVRKSMIMGADGDGSLERKRKRNWAFWWRQLNVNKGKFRGTTITKVFPYTE